MARAGGDLGLSLPCSIRAGGAPTPLRPPRGRRGRAGTRSMQSGRESPGGPQGLAAKVLQPFAPTQSCPFLVGGGDGAPKKVLFSGVMLVRALRRTVSVPRQMSVVAKFVPPLLPGRSRRYRVHHSGIRITG